MPRSSPAPPTPPPPRRFVADARRPDGWRRPGPSQDPHNRLVPPPPRAAAGRRSCAPYFLFLLSPVFCFFARVATVWFTRAATHRGIPATPTRHHGCLQTRTTRHAPPRTAAGRSGHPTLDKRNLPTFCLLTCHCRARPPLQTALCPSRTISPPTPLHSSPPAQSPPLESTISPCAPHQSPLSKPHLPPDRLQGRAPSPAAAAHLPLPFFPCLSGPLRLVPLPSVPARARRCGAWRSSPPPRPWPQPPAAAASAAGGRLRR